MATPERPYVFISYSRRDEAFVDRLAKDLRKAGVEIWRDVEHIRPGQDWQKEIETAVSAASLFLFVASASSVASAWMATELGAFLGRGGNVVPLVIDDDAIKQLPPPLSGIPDLLT